MARTMTISVDYDMPMCANCKHFYQHYIWDSWKHRHTRIHVGHCVYPRIKDRLATATCNKFAERERTESAS